VYEDLAGVAALPLRGAKSLAAKLEQHREQAFLSRRLATVAYDAPVDAELADLEWDGADAERLDALFEKVGFDTLRTRVTKWKDGPRESEARPSTR
jgi:DNA polymerase-1